MTAPEDSHQRGEQVWDIPEVRRVAQRVGSAADRVASVGDTLRSLAMPTHDGAGGAVADAFATYQDAVVDLVTHRSERLANLSEDVLRGTLAIEAADAASGSALESTMNGHLIFGGDLADGNGVSPFRSPVSDGR